MFDRIFIDPLHNRVAFIDLHNVRAGIYFGGHPVYKLKYDDPEPSPFREGDLQMWMGHTDVEVRSLDELFPFPRLHKYLREIHHRHSTVELFLRCISIHQSDDEDGAIATLENDLEDPVVKEFVRTHLVSHELPKHAYLDDMPKTGHIADLVAAIRERWNIELSPMIRA